MPTAVAGRAAASGAGTVDAAGGPATFAFSVRRARPGDGVSGRLVYRIPGRDLTVISSSVDTLDVSGAGATFSGTCRLLPGNTPCAFVARAVEGGPVGGGGSLTVEVSGAGADGGPLRSGIIRVSTAGDGALALPPGGLLDLTTEPGSLPR